MNRVKRIFLCVLVSLVALSCAKEYADPSINFSEDSFLAWMKKNAPNADSIAGNVYIEYFERADNWESLLEPTLDTTWMRLNYTGRTFAGDIFETRDSSLARLMGTWAYTTHFVDDYLFFSEYTSKLCYGFLVGLDNMRVGDSARIYIPSSSGYSGSMSTNSGYVGLTSAYLGYPVYFDVRLKAMDDDPYETEVEALNKWVAENWGMSEADTLKKGFYYRIIESNPLGDTITKDSVATYDYDSYFLDGQLINTTDEDLALEAGYFDDATLYSSVSITASTFTDTTSTYQVFPQTILQMREGEVAEAVTISTYAAGIYGDETATPQILPYQPQLFKIYVLDDEEEDEDEDDDE